MIRFKRITALLLAFSCLALAGCGSQSAQSSSDASSDAPTFVYENDPGYTAESLITTPWDEGVLPQFQPPESGSPIVTLHTDAGDIKMMLFPKAAPLAVENFVKHCEEGYYDNVTFHRVIEGFMIQGGDPQGTGMGGESIYGGGFEDEFSYNLYNFRGALSMANAGYGTNGSQFFIVQDDAVQYPNGGMRVNDENFETVLQLLQQNSEVYAGTLRLIHAQQDESLADEDLEQFVNQLNDEIAAVMQGGVPDALRAKLTPAVQKYMEVGGAPTLDFKHTVFGQVIEGMDVVDAIAKAESSDPENGTPVKPAVILSATVEKAA